MDFPQHADSAQLRREVRGKNSRYTSRLSNGGPRVGLVRKLWMSCALLLAGCQHANLLIDEADLSRFDECLALQQSLAERTDAQMLQLEVIREQSSHGPELLVRLDALKSELDDLRQDLAPQECPQPETVASVIAVAATDDMVFAGEKLVVGEIETVRFDNLGLALRARIDTGAETSSLDARRIRRFQRDGENWVRFTIPDPDSGEPLVLERPRSRRVRILQAGAEDPDTRHVVELRVTLGNSTQTAEFTLTDRSALEFPVLIGRNVLRDLMMVDVSRVDAAPPAPLPDEAAAGGR